MIVIIHLILSAIIDFFSATHDLIPRTGLIIIELIHGKLLLSAE